MLKKLLSYSLLLASFFFIFSTGSYAQAATDESCPGGEGWLIRPCPLDINGNTDTVTLIFPGIGTGEWHHCTRTDGCGRARETVEADSEGNLLINVCADGNKRLKIAGTDNDSSCGSGDYFHEGRIYKVALFQDEEQEETGPVATFFVNRFYPTVTVSNTTNNLLSVNIEGVRKPNSNAERNNYNVVLQGIDNIIRKRQCVWLVQPDRYQYSVQNSVTFGRNPDNNEPLLPGNYVLSIKEQTNESTTRGPNNQYRWTCSNSGEFTYWDIFFEVDNEGQIFINGRSVYGEGQDTIIHGPISCSQGPDYNPASPRNDLAYDPDTRTEWTGGCVQDPTSGDLGKYNQFLNSLLTTGNTILPCSENLVSDERCVGVNTAIGRIPTSITGFIERLFSIVLSLAGIAAVGLLIYGGYNYMISRGDPEKIKGARETITSAIIGLLFIIFSFVILQVIAVDILRIPGFN